MNEQFDADLSRALKSGAAKELQGWEFTPAMRKNVLARIRTESSGTAAPAGHRRPVSVPRPLIWATVAAAAFMIALKVDVTNLFGAGQKSTSAPQAPAAASSTASAPTPAPQPAQAQELKTEATAAKAMDASPAGAAANSGSVGAQNASAGTSVAKERSVAAASIRLETPTTPPSPGVADAAATLSAEAGFTAKASFVSFHRYAVAAQGKQVLMLDSNGLSAVNHDGVTDWQAPIPGVGFESVLAISADGRIAVNAENKVYLVSGTGKVDATLELEAPATRVTWAPDGRLAVVGTSAQVYKDGKAQFKVPAEVGSQLAFGPEGTLVVLEPGGNLYVYDRDGKAVAAQPRVGGGVLAYGPDEETIITASGAYSRKLDTLRWKMPFEPLGLTLAGDTVIAWNADQIVGLRSQDGTQLWHAAREGAGPGIVKVVTNAGAEGGNRVIVLAATDTGAALWAFLPTGEVKLTQALTAMPLDLTVVGNRVTLLMTGGPEVHEIP